MDLRKYLKDKKENTNLKECIEQVIQQYHTLNNTQPIEMDCKVLDLRSYDSQ